MTLVPLAATISCGHAKSKGRKPTKKMGQKLARYRENQTYLNYTGYDPQKQLSDYHLDWIDNDSFDSYWNDLEHSWGNNEKNKLLFYHKKWNNFQKNYPKKSDNSQWFIVSLDGDAIPSLELYDFVHALQWKSYLIEHNAGHPERIARSNVTFPYKSDWKD